MMEYSSNDINKIEYQAFFESTYLPIYFAPWWLDATCGSDLWNVVFSKNPDGGIEGILVFHIKPFFGQSVILMPPLTSYGGIWFNYPSKMKSHSKISFEKKTINKLIVQLPKHTLYFQQFHPRYQNWLPFYWQDFQQTTRYTYIIDLKQSLDQIWDQFKGNIRRNIRKAESSGFVCTESQDFEAFWLALNQSYQNRGKAIPFQESHLRSVEEVCSKNKARKIFVAQNAEGNLLAGIYLIFDQKSSYYLVGFFDPTYKDYAALTLCLWHGISEMTKIVEKFDFEGSIIEEIEFFFRAFGGTLTPHFKISKAKNKTIKFLTKLKNPKFFE